MNWKHTIWIVLLCLLIGYILGLYYNLPQTITIDYGENIVQVMDKIDKINMVKINKTGVILNCSMDRFHACQIGAVFQLTEDFPDINMIDGDTWEAIEKYCEMKK